MYCVAIAQSDGFEKQLTYSYEMISIFKRGLVVIVACVPLLLNAQVKDTISTSAKIDSIYNFQKKMYAESKNSPLAEKKVGLEFNFFRLLMIDSYPTVSGGVSLFNINRQAEVSIPFYIQGQKESGDLIDITVDCHFRYFLGNTQNGFYLSAFARYAYLKGTLGEDYLFGSSVTNTKSDESKLGVGVGIGCRIFSYRGLYWGTSISFGRYIVGESNKFASGILSMDDDNEYILDFELLKFGWAF